GGRGARGTSHPRHDPHGPAAARPQRVRRHAANQGTGGAATHSLDRRHVVRAERRRREGPRRRRRRLRHEALQPPRAAREGARPDWRRVRTPPLVLVADDNAMNVDILRTRLTNGGYGIITAGDGEAALAAARAEHPDLILLDVMMPKMDGLAVC